MLSSRLNAIREICARCPLVMNADLLRELVEYRTSKQKSVMMAARSILQLYRVVNPELLPRKERVSHPSITLSLSLPFFLYRVFFPLFLVVVVLFFICGHA